MSYSTTGKGSSERQKLWPVNYHIFEVSRISLRFRLTKNIILQKGDAKNTIDLPKIMGKKKQISQGLLMGCGLKVELLWMTATKG